MASVGGSEAVSTKTEELLDSGYICLPERIQLADLDQPNALEQFAGFLTLECSDAVIEPALTHLIEECGLTDTLRSCKDQHGVVLAPRLHRSRHRSYESLSGDSSGIGLILRAQILHKQRIETRIAVPRQGGQIVADIVEFVLVTVERQRTVDFAVAGDLVDLLEVPVKTLIVVVRPAASFLKGTPRKVAEDLAASGKLVQGEFAFQIRVVFEDEPNVVDGGFNRAGLIVQFQIHRPLEPAVLFVRSSQSGEIADGRIGSFLRQLS